MKIIKCILLGSIFFLSSCMDMNIEGIFNGHDESVIAPVANETLTEAGLSEFFYSDDFYWLAEAFLSENAPNNYEDFAFVVNNAQQLSSVPEIEWPDIDFNNYSLIIGQYQRSMEKAVYLKDTRVENRLGSLKLYLHLCAIPNVGVMGDAVRLHIPFCALYPKLPDKSVKVITWRDY